ncbi:MAG: STAS domain-containing protein [Ilumatobacter sp.]
MTTPPTNADADSPSTFEIRPVDVSRLALVGEFDADASERFDDQLATRTPADLGVDLSQVSFIDSSGLRSLIVARQRLEAEGFVLNLESPSDSVVRLFEISGLTQYLEVS